MKNRMQNSINVKEIVGSRIKKARKDFKISREKLCAMLNKQEPEMNELRPDTLKQWELGVNQINIAWIPAICKVLNCDTGYLFGEREEKTYLACDIREEIGLEESAIVKLNRLKRLDSYYSRTIQLLLSSIITDDYLLPEIYRSFVTMWNLTRSKSTTNKTEPIDPKITKDGVFLFGEDAIDTILFSVQKKIVDFMRDFFDIAEGRIYNASEK